MNLDNKQTYLSIPEEHHRTLMSHLNDIRSHYNVRIKIPDRGTTNDSGPQIEGIGLADLIQITGRVLYLEFIHLQKICNYHYHSIF